MKTISLCDGPGPNPDCPQLTVNDDGGALIGEDDPQVGLCRLNKSQFNKLKEAIAGMEAD